MDNQHPNNPSSSPPLSRSPEELAEDEASTDNLSPDQVASIEGLAVSEEHEDDAPTEMIDLTEDQIPAMRDDGPVLAPTPTITPPPFAPRFQASPPPPSLFEGQAQRPNPFLRPLADRAPAPLEQETAPEIRTPAGLPPLKAPSLKPSYAPLTAPPLPKEEFEPGEATSVFEHALPPLGELAPVASSPHLEATPSSFEQPMFEESAATLVGASQLDLSGEELDDEFAEQKTEVIQSPFEQEAIMPKLKVVEGPMQGQEFLLTTMRSTVGRGHNNSASVEDLAMSRLHFEILRNEDNSYLLRDLGSANGTALNGTRVKEAILFDDDRIEAGKSILAFHHVASAPRPARHLIAVAGATLEGHLEAEPQPMEQSGPDERTRMAAIQMDQSTRLFTRIALIAGALCIPLCFVLIFAITSLSSPATSAPALEDTPQAVAAAAPQDNNADTLYLQGVEAIKAQRWQEAEALFGQASALEATLNVTPQLRRIEREVAAFEALTSARQQDEPERIVALAERVPESSVYYDEAQKLIRLNRQDKVTLAHQRALTLLSEGKLDEAEAAIASLQELSPQHAALQELAATLATRREELEALMREQQQDAAVAAKADGMFPSEQRASPSKSSSAEDSKAALKEGYSHYRSKRWSQAESSFKEVGGKKGSRLARYVSTVSSQWSAGSKALSSGDHDKAIAALKKAYDADKRVNKAHRGSIGEELAQAYGGAGLARIQSKDYIDARKQLVSGRKISSKEGSLARLSGELEKEAKKLYVKAANKKKTDQAEAIQLCREIMLMLPSSSATYKKAQKLIFDI